MHKRNQLQRKIIKNLMKKKLNFQIIKKGRKKLMDLSKKKIQKTRNKIQLRLILPNNNSLNNG